jgi:hypothetical protein
LSRLAVLGGFFCFWGEFWIFALSPALHENFVLQIGGLQHLIEKNIPSTCVFEQDLKVSK